MVDGVGAGVVLEQLMDLAFGDHHLAVIELDQVARRPDAVGVGVGEHRSSRVGGGGIQASGSSPRRSLFTSSRASRSSFFTRRCSQCSPEGWARWIGEDRRRVGAGDRATRASSSSNGLSGLARSARTRQPEWKARSIVPSLCGWLGRGSYRG